MGDNNEPVEEFSFRFLMWELKVRKPGTHTVTILMIISVLIITLTVLLL